MEQTVVVYHLTDPDLQIKTYSFQDKMYALCLNIRQGAGKAGDTLQLADNILRPPLPR